jgi:hypothetical protein
MATFILIYHSGVVITNEIGSYEFDGMKKETFLLNEFPDTCKYCLFSAWAVGLDG